MTAFKLGGAVVAGVILGVCPALLLILAIDHYL